MFWKKKSEGPTFTPQFDLPPMPPLSIFRGHRPCLADGKPATFHRWVDRDTSLLHVNVFTRMEERELIHRQFKQTGVVPNCCSADVVRAVFALVEYPDGSIGEVKPELIRFTDRETDDGDMV